MHKQQSTLAVHIRLNQILTNFLYICTKVPERVVKAKQHASTSRPSATNPPLWREEGRSRILVTNCEFQIINSETGEILFIPRLLNLVPVLSATFQMNHLVHAETFL